MSDRLRELIERADRAAERPTIAPLRLTDLERRARVRRARRAGAAVMVAATAAAVLAFATIRSGEPPSSDTDLDELLARTELVLARTLPDEVDRARLDALEEARTRAFVATTRAAALAEEVDEGR